MFLNAIMLAGITGAALPLVVHLLSRARVKTVDWGAMMFLEGEGGSQEHAARLKQWTLLLLRMGTVALLAIAMARPIAAEDWAAPAGPQLAVIVVDASASMLQSTGSGRTRGDAAREAVLNVLSTLEKGDRASLIIAGGTPGGRGAAVAQTADLQAVAARAAEMKVGSGAADIATALNEAAGILERHGAANGRLYLVCDAQASGWDAVDETFQESWRRRTTRNGRPLPFDVIVVGDGAAAVENTAIESVAVVAPPVIAGLAADVEVKVRHFGSSARAQLPLSVRSAKGEVFSGTVDVAAGATADVTIPVTFGVAGQHTLTAEIASGTLSFDDRMQHVVDVVPPVRVLVVSGDERAGGFRGEADFLRAALAPFAAVNRPAVDPARVTVLPVDGWTDGRVADADVLVLANVAELTPQQVRSVEAFVYGGGGLLVAPGGTTRPDSYNRTLFRDAAGLLPASLAGPIADQPTSLLGIELSHPIFTFLRGRPDPIPSAVVARLFAASPRPGAAVLASYVTGQPFLVESSYGRGRVLLMTTTIDADWNTLPLSGFYLPFAQSTVRYLAAAALPQRSLAPGQELRARFSEAPNNMSAILLAPGGRRLALPVGGYEGSYEVATADTYAPGLYTLRATAGGREHVERFVVRHPAAESDLTSLVATQWSKLQRGLAFRRPNANARTILPQGTAGRGGRELWLPLLLGAFALIAAELLLTRLWSEGRG